MGSAQVKQEETDEFEKGKNLFNKQQYSDAVEKFSNIISICKRNNSDGIYLSYSSDN
jgi:hypothetical protein